MSPSLQNLRITAKYALCSATLALAVLAPVMTFAAGEPTATGGTRIGKVLVRGELVKDENAKTGWVVAVTAENPTAKATHIAMNTMVTRTQGRPMARVVAAPIPVFNELIAMDIDAHGTTTTRVDVPEDVAKQLDAQANAANTQVVAAPMNVQHVATTQAPLPLALRSVVRYGLRFDHANEAKKAPTQAVTPLAMNAPRS